MRDENAPLATLGCSADGVFTLLLMAGAFSVPFAAHAGIALVLVGFGGLLATHLAVGIVAYRRVMSRPWPRVSTLEEDDDW